MALEKELLEFNFDKSSFLSHLGISTSLKNNIELRIRKIEKLNLSDFGVTPDDDIKEKVFLKFKKYFLKETDFEFSKKELRLLSHSLNFSNEQFDSIFDEKDELKDCLFLINQNWSDSFLLGLTNCLLEGWRYSSKSSKEILSNFIVSKLNNYNGQRKSILALKSFTRYLNPNIGDMLLGGDLVEKKISLEECTQHLNIPQQWFRYPYFSNVILTYYSKRKNDLEHILEELEFALIQHPRLRLKQKIISKLIIQATEDSFYTFQDKIKVLAFNILKDPEVAPRNWQPRPNSSFEYSNELTKARDILNQWLIQQFINVFFEKCINDPRRKRFWLRYSKHISQFNVIGSKYTRRLLLNDERIKEFVPSRFKISSTGDDSAIMFSIQNYILVEFSDTGKLYAYKKANPQAPKFDTLSYSNTSDLKLNFAFQKQLIYRTGRKIDSASNEGSQPHHDGEMTWEEVFSKWINLKIGI